MSKSGHEFSVGDHVVYPAHGVGQGGAGNAVGEEEVKVLLLEDAVAETFGAHGWGWDGVGNGRSDFRIRNPE